MKAISTRTTKGVMVGSRLKCIDNTGAKQLEVIAVRGFKGIRKRIPRAGVGDVVVCSVKAGNQKIKHEVVRAVVVRQARPYKRASGINVQFSDNAAVLVQENFEPRGKEIKGAVAKEVVERFPAIGKIASIIV